MKLVWVLLGCLLLACSGQKHFYRFPEPKGFVSANDAPASGVVQPAKTEVVPIVQPPPNYSVDAAAPTPAPKRKGQAARKQALVPVAKAAPAPVELGEGLDADFKRSVIFLVAGGIALLIGGEVFVVAGSLSLLIGLIFGIKWFIRQ